MALTVAQLVARLSADTSGFYKSMAIANSSLLRTGGIVGRVFAGAGIATTAFGFLSLRMAGNYQQSMNVLQAVTGATGKQMDTLGDQAIALGADMKLPNVSARDAADAMTALGKGGLSVKQIMGATRGVLQLGIASNTDFADSAVIVARALKAFGLQGTEATHVADLFTSAANASTSEMGDIALGFQMASAQFKRGQQSIEDLTTAITIMNDAGVVGSDAGTSLKTMMNRLLSPTAKAKAVMDGLGISVYNAAGNVKPMPQLVSMFTSKLKGLSNEQRNAALYTIFGSDAIRAANIVLTKGRKHWDEYSKKVNASGSAQRMAEARTKGFNGALQAFQSQIETLAINLGVHMLPAATKIVRAMSNFVASIDADKVAAFAGAIINAAGGIVKFVAHSQALTSILAGIVAGFVAFRVISSVVAGVRALSAAMVALNIVMDANPVILIAAALVGLGIALVVLYQRSETFRKIVQTAFQGVIAAGNALISAFNFVKDHWLVFLYAMTGGLGVAVAMIIKHWGQIKNAVTSAVNAIVNFVRAHWTLLITILLGPLGLLVVQIVRFWSQIRTATETAWNVIKAVVTTAAHAISTAVSAAVGVIKGIISAGWRAIVAATRTIWGLIPKAVFTALGKIPGAIARAAAATYQAALALGRGIMDGILSGISGLPGALASKIAGAAKGAISHAAGILGIHSPSTYAADKIGKPLGQGIIVGFLLGTRDLPSTVSSRVQKALEAGQRKIAGFQDKFRTAFDRIKDTALSAFDAITSQHQTPTEKLIADIDDARTQKRLADAVTKAQDTLNQAIADGSSPQEIADLQQELDDAKYEQWKYGAEKQADAERKDYDAQRALQRQHLEDQLNDLEEYLSKHPGKWKNAQDMITNLLNGYGLTYQNIGRALGDAYVTGMKESFGDLVKMLHQMANLIAKYLKIKSPAERGPLSDLNHWWDNFADTLTAGLDMRPIEQASRSMAGVSAGAMSGARYGPSAAGASTVVIPLYNPVFLGQDREMARKLAETVKPHLDRGISVS